MDFFGLKSKQSHLRNCFGLHSFLGRFSNTFLYTTFVPALSIIIDFK